MNFSHTPLIPRRVVALAFLSITLVLCAAAQKPMSIQKVKAPLIPAKTLHVLQPNQDTAHARTVSSNVMRFVEIYPVQNYHMALRPARLAAQIGDVVSFEVEHSFPSNLSLYRFAVDYDDGTRDLLPFDSPKAFHTFRLARTFKVVASVVLYSELKAMAYVPQYRDSVTITIDSVSLKVAPEVATVGEQVRFTVLVDTTAAGTVYRFQFGDNIPASPWSASLETQHAYTQPGTYSVFAEIGRRSHGIVLPIIKSRVQEVRVLAPTPATLTEVDLWADSLHVLVAMPLTFTASAIPPSVAVRYRFVFGDGDQTQWQGSASATHKYKSAREFKVYAEASYSQGVLQSNSLLIRVEPVRPPLPDGHNTIPPWVWVGAGLALTAAIVFGVRPVRQWIIRPRVTILVKQDKEAPRLNSFAPPKIAVRLILRSGPQEEPPVARPKGNKLIKSIRRKHA